MNLFTSSFSLLLSLSSLSSSLSPSPQHTHPLLHFTNLGICSNTPEDKYLMNSCISAEVSVELSNDGEHYSGMEFIRNPLSPLHFNEQTLPRNGCPLWGNTAILFLIMHGFSSSFSSSYCSSLFHDFAITLAIPGGVESSGVEMAGTSILSTARYDDGLGDKIVLNFGNYTTSASFAVYTYVQPSEFNSLNSMIYQMETSHSLIAIYAEEGNPSLTSY